MNSGRRHRQVRPVQGQIKMGIILKLVIVAVLVLGVQVNIKTTEAAVACISPASGSTVSPNNVVFTWSAAQGASSYLFRLEDPTFSNGSTNEAIIVNDLTGTSFTGSEGNIRYNAVGNPINLAPGKSYRWRIWYGDEATNGSSCDFTTLSPPTDPSASCPAPGTTANFSWTGVAGATRYDLYAFNTAYPVDWNAACGSGGRVLCQPVTGTSYSADNLSAGTNYQWFVFACNSSGCNKTPASYSTSFTCIAPAATPTLVPTSTPTPPSIPPLPVAACGSPSVGAKVNPKNINFSWGPVPGAQLYDFRLWDYNLSGWNDATDYLRESIVINDLPGTSYNGSGGRSLKNDYGSPVNLGRGQNYRYRVSARNAQSDLSTVTWSNCNFATLDCTDDGDLNGDGNVNDNDFTAWEGAFLSGQSTPAGCGVGTRADLKLFNAWRSRRP